MKNAILFCSLLILFFQAQAFASLGDSDASIQNDGKVSHTTHTLIETTQYKRHELSNPKVTIHEFSGASSGKVFAVAWRGSAHPDLKTLLGSYYPEFQASYVKANAGHHHGGVLIVDSANLHIEMSGRMMAVNGQVWLTSQIPSGMDLHEIK